MCAKPERADYPEVMVDGNSQGFLHYSQYLAIELPPGQHAFRLTGLTKGAKWEPRDVDRSINLTPGETAFLEFRVEFNTAETGLLNTGPKYMINLNQIYGSQAGYEVRATTKTKQ